MAESPTDGIVALIRERALANGVDPAALVRIAQIESGLNPSAANPSSSAKGLFQFVDRTAKQYGLTNPLDPAASADAGARFAADNMKAIGSREPGDMYLAHFAGVGGAKSVLGADPSAPAGAILGPAAVKANPFLANMSVGDLRAWAARKMGGGAAPVISSPGNSGTVAQQPAPPGMQSAPVAAPAPAPPDDSALMAALQAVASAGQRSDMPDIAPVKINMPVPHNLSLARALSRAMSRRPLA